MNLPSLQAFCTTLEWKLSSVLNSVTVALWSRKCGNYGETDIVRAIKASRIKWLGIFVQIYMPMLILPKKVSLSKIEGTRCRERSRTRWLDDVSKDLKLMGIKEWKVIVTNRVSTRGESARQPCPTNFCLVYKEPKA
ncbi:hypothetical protein TNCV_2401311 [Trichonephila clavipes]|nr:hypothetical protein TNCV_2401311 [Trichonephila clavipes]